MNKNSGFTLIEVLITIALIAIVLAIFTPEFMNWQERQRFRSTASDVSLVIRKARMDAINGHFNVVVSFTPGTGASANYRAFVDDGGGNPNTLGAYDAGEQVLQPITTMPDSVRIVSANDIRFNSMGIPAGGSSTIQLNSIKDATLTSSILVSPAGHISLN